MRQVIETHLPRNAFTAPHSVTVDRSGLVGLRDHPGRERLPECCRVCPLHPGQLEQPAPVSREWLYDGGDRAHPCKTELDVSLCFAPLLRWVLAWWRSGRLALAVDPTLKGDDTTAIVISVVYRGCAIPVAWRILRANQRGAWMDPIVELLQALAPAVPREMTRGNDRGGAVRPGLGQSEIVETDSGPRLASLHEVSEKRHFLR